jgi:hypothetical protein
MYDHTGQPPNEHDEHEVSKVTIHCPIIAVLSPRKSSNHAVRLKAPRRDALSALGDELFPCVLHIRTV